MNRALKWTLIVSGIAALAFGARWAYIQYVRLKDFCFNYVGYKMLSLSMSRIQFEVMVSVKNKSDVTINVTSYDCEIFLNGNLATRVKNPTQIKIQANSFGEFPILVDANFREVFKSIVNPSTLASLLMNYQQLRVRTKGFITTNGIQNIPIDLEYTLAEMLPDENNPQSPCR